MTEPYPPPTPEERQLRAQRLAGGGGLGGPGFGPGLEQPGGFWRGRSAGLPNWAWIAGGVVVGAIVLIWWFKRGSNSGDGGADIGQATVVDDSSGIATGQYETILTQIRDLQGIEAQEVLAQQAATTTPTATTPPVKATSQPPIPTPTKTVPPPVRAPVKAASPAASYLIKSGDTLSAIAARMGTTVTKLYAKNQAIIESAARAHGRSSSRGGPNSSVGWWIFPGTRLVKP